MIKHAVLITGDRGWRDMDAVGSAMGAFPSGTLFIHGNATGADFCCDEMCTKMGYPKVRVPYFSHLGRAGGPVRNQYMLELLEGLARGGTEVLVLAFHDNLSQSKGTRDMILRARKAGVRVKLLRHKGDHREEGNWEHGREV